jgi:hypothetical protein
MWGMLDIEDLIHDLKARLECNGKVGILGFCFGGGCFRSVDLPSDDPPKFITIDEETNHQIMHALRFGETDRAPHQPLDPRP